MAFAQHTSQPITQPKRLDKSAIRKMAQRSGGFRVNAADIKQRPLINMALELVQQGEIYQDNRMGDIVVYRAVEHA